MNTSVSMKDEHGNEIILNRFAFIHVRRHLVKSFYVGHWCSVDHTGYIDKGFNNIELRIPHSIFNENLVSVEINNVDFDRSNKDFLKAVMRNGEDPIKVIPGYSKIKIIDSQGAILQVISEFDELEISGHFWGNIHSYQKYKLDFNTLCELMRKP